LLLSAHPIRSRCGRAIAGALMVWVLVTRTAAADVRLADVPDTPQRGIDPGSVTVAVLEDGRFAVAGAQALLGTAAVAFVIQRYSADGRRDGPLLRVAEGPGIAGGIGAFGDSYFVTVRQLNKRPRAARLDPAGRLLGSWHTWIPSATYYYASHYIFGRAPAWSFLPVSFEVVGKTPGLGADIVAPIAHLFGPTLLPLGPQFPLGGQNRLVDLLDASLNGVGRLIVLSDVCPLNLLSSKPCERGVQAFDRSGRPRSAFTKVAVPQARPGISGLRVALRNDGSSFLAWVQASAGGDVLHGSLLSRDGTAASPAWSIASDGGFIRPGSARWLDTARLAFPWIVTNLPGAEHEAIIAISEVRPLSHEVASRVEVTRGAVYGSTFAFAVNEGGDGVVYWSTLEDDGEISGHLRRVLYN